jgi:phosphatidylinositol dimannoside acyltransferase
MTSGDRPQPASATRPSGIDRRLEAPHRRGGASPRVVERLAVLGYRATAWLLSSVPPKPAAAIIGRLSQLSYLAWPTKRHWSNRNFGHVLGLPRDHPRVREAAMAAYMGYGRYLVELMRLPSMPPEQVAKLAPDLDVEEVRRIWQEAPGGGLILTVGHLGSNEAIAAAIAHHGMPISVVADDSAFPEIYEILRRQREGWGVKLIAWRNLREIFGVLRRREILGLLVDWGYRADGIPVRLFGEWTALPAGPATLAAKSRSLILPISIRRLPDDSFHVSWSTAIEVPSSDPADLQRATQAIADALASSVAAAPDQWYSFKPIWPSTPDEAADLERRAGLMLDGVADPGPAPEFA